MTIGLSWNTLSIDEWERRFALLPHSNILQSYTYARAYCPFAKQKARWGLIEIDGKEAGLVQMFEAGILWNAVHALMIDRGPLWFEGFGNAMHVKRFHEELNRQFPARRGRKRRVLPEVEDGPSAQKMIAQMGFERLDRTGYETVWLDLALPEETLRSNLKQNWRNKLNKSERSGTEIDWSVTPEHIAWMLAVYASDKGARDYGGPAPEFLKIYLPMLAANGDLVLARAVKDGKPTAFVLLVSHGRSATYLAGWSSEQGREDAAHHLLLWEGMKRLKEKGIKELDLGGINDESAAGIKTFKEGLGGRSVRYVGHYR